MGSLQSQAMQDDNFWSHSEARAEESNMYDKFYEPKTIIFLVAPKG